MQLCTNFLLVNIPFITLGGIFSGYLFWSLIIVYLLHTTIDGLLQNYNMIKYRNLNILLKAKLDHS